MDEPPAFVDGYPAPGVVESAAFVALIDRAAIISTEHQEHVSALHGEDSWGLDATTQQFRFIAPDGSISTARAHLLGSAATGPMSWLWAWVNANGFAEAFFARSVEVRERGAGDCAPELTTDELPLTEGLPLRLTIAAKAVTGLTAHYSAPAGGGTRIWLLLEDEGLALPAPTVLRTMEALRIAIETVQIQDQLAAVEAYAEQRGIPIAPVPTEGDDPADAEARRLDLPDGRVVILFDARRRMIRLQADVEARGAGASAAAEPAETLPAAHLEPAAAGNPSPVTAPGKGLIGRLFGRRSS